MGIRKSIADYFGGLAEKKRAREIDALSEGLYQACLDKVPLEELKDMIEKGADPSFKNSRVVRHAVIEKDAGLFSLFIDHVKDPASVHELLLDSIRGGNAEAFGTLLSRSPEMPIKNWEKAFSLSIECYNPAATIALAAYHPTMKENFNPLDIIDWAIQKDDNRIFGIVCDEYGLREYSTMFLDAAEKHNAVRISGILKKRIDEHSEYLKNVILAPEEALKPYNMTRAEMVRLNLQQGADPAANESAMLAYAVLHGYKDCVKELVKAGAKIEDKDSRALRLAKKKGQKEISKYLKDHMDKNGIKPVKKAAKKVAKKAQPKRQPTP